ncbi:MAG: hypothetical protein KDK39_12840 [Leptospiraceae bacterium]|nr:hypothetical protein [Leptospiraceae bacterium]
MLKRIALGKALLLLLLIAINPAGAESLPGWQTVQDKLPLLWSSRFPVKVHRFLANPEKKGILRTVVQGHAVYYYHFIAIIPRPQRTESRKIEYTPEARRVEIWVRYRPWLAEKWDLSFARQDLLPGSNRKWLRQATSVHPARALYP